jgi:hypothetical protein
LRKTAFVRPSCKCTLQTHPLVREGARIKNGKCPKIISKEEKDKLVGGPRLWPDTRTDWPNDHRSYDNFDFNSIGRFCITLRRTF